MEIRIVRVRVCLCGCFTLMTGRSLNVFWCTAIEKWTSFESSVLDVQHPIIVQRKTNCISLCDWDMKLGVLPLWSASKELSNDVIKVINEDGHIFAKNRTQAKAYKKLAASVVATKHNQSYSQQLTSSGPGLASLVFHDFGSKSNPQQNWHHLKALFMLITMVQISDSYLIPSPRYIS